MLDCVRSPKAWKLYRLGNLFELSSAAADATLRKNSWSAQHGGIEEVAR